MKTFKLIKKGRKYFSAKLISNNKEYDCKIEIDELSESLELDKELNLEVDDISIRSKYGVELKFKLVSKVENDSLIQFKCDYNERLITELHKIGGKYDNKEKVWLIHKKFENELEELDYIYNSSQKLVKIEILKDIRLETDFFNIAYKFNKRGELKSNVAINGNWSFGGSGNYPYLELKKDSWFVIEEKVEYIKMLEKENDFFKVEVL